MYKKTKKPKKKKYKMHEKSEPISIIRRKVKEYERKQED